MKMTDGLATSSTAMVRRLRCSTLSPLCPGMPTSVWRSGVSSTMSITSFTNSRTCNMCTFMTLCVRSDVSGSLPMSFLAVDSLRAYAAANCCLQERPSPLAVAQR